MCIIAICLTRKLTEDELANCWSSNKDGAGIGWAENGKVKYKKGFTKLEDLKGFYSNFPSIPHVLHFRTGTSGGYSPQMTHPFIVDKEGSLDLEYEGTKSILFHNGVVSDWKDMALTYFLSNNIRIPKGEWSDTRLLAVLCSQMGFQLLEFIYGKFAVIHKDGTIEQHGAFIEDEGNFYSNSDYKGRTTYIGGSCGVGNYENSFFRNVVVGSDNSTEKAEVENEIGNSPIPSNVNPTSDDELYAMKYIEKIRAMDRDVGDYMKEKYRNSSPVSRLSSDDKSWKRSCRWLFSKEEMNANKNISHKRSQYGR